ncbi:hypothetical protein [Nonomuraea sp. SYSU D8015]|uniref:hypothetical protein n=1 Tax=Nonomuraea sp. SYSU D8015 TaxID=2593644 RepID=UPI0016603DEA|nr:hypothetical protein [Nonomuraea sp. SYSU D8015]
MNIRLLPAAALLVLGLAACGGAKAGDDGVASATGASGAATVPAATSSASLDPGEAALKFAQCMRQQGIDMPDPKPQGGGIQFIRPQGVSEDKLEKAHKSCEHFLESAAPAGETPSAEDYDRMVKFAQCMRQQGIDMPDPKPGEGMRIRMKGGSKEKLDAAHKACEQFQPGGKGDKVTSGGKP